MAARDFEALKHALISAGTPFESVQILTKHARAELDGQSGLDDSQYWIKSGASSDSLTAVDSSAPTSRASPDKQFWVKKSVQAPRDFSWGRPTQPGRSTPVTPLTGLGDSCNEQYLDDVNESIPHFSTCRLDRSLVLTGLSSHTTLAEILKQIKGGMLLNIYMKRQDGTAHVAFVDPDAAEKFLMHVKRHDLYIKNKRVIVSWDEKQRYISGGIQKQIYCSGATRNMVLRFPTPGVTEQTIRDDLQHIDMLEIVSVQHTGGHFYISLNSVGHALAARSCMQHRSRYKASRIEFYPDECAESLPLVAKRVAPDPLKHDLSGNRPKLSINRFDVLFDESAS